MPRHMPRRRKGFTLVEMLVVVAIIGILAAMMIPAIWMAIIAARNGAIAIEIGVLENALQTYRVQYGKNEHYPPNFSGAALGGSTPWSGVPKVVAEHMQMAFPRINFATATAPPTTMNTAETLVFWLRGFGPDPTNPLAGTRKGVFDFDQPRLIDNDGDATVGNDPTPIYCPQNGAQKGYVYFHSGSYANFTSTPQPIKPYLAATPAGTYMKPQSFQIVSAGLDGEYGVGGLAFPTGPFTGVEKDNITNFSEGTLESKQQ